MARGPLKGKEEVPAKERGRRHTLLDKDRHSIVDAMPLEPPLGYKRAPTLAEQIKQMVRGEQLAAAARASGRETFEEADDFVVDEIFDPQSPYEEEFDPPPPTWEEQSTALGKALARGMQEYNEAVARELAAKTKKEGEAEPPPVAEGDNS